MSASTASARTDGLAIGRASLQQLHRSLLQHAPEQVVTVLQETGYASGEGIYQAFCAWLPGAAGVTRPEDLDTADVNSVLAEFLRARGRGARRGLDRLGGSRTRDRRGPHVLFLRRHAGRFPGTRVGGAGGGDGGGMPVEERCALPFSLRST